MPVLKEEEAKRIAGEMVARIVIAAEQWDEATGAYTIVGVMPLYGQHSPTYLGAKAMTSFTPIDLKDDMIGRVGHIGRPTPPHSVPRISIFRRPVLHVLYRDHFIRSGDRLPSLALSPSISLPLAQRRSLPPDAQAQCWAAG